MFDVDTKETIKTTNEELLISIEYMERERVFDWVSSYLVRNSIPATRRTVLHNGGFYNRDEQDYLFITFKSVQQRDNFLWRARREFPYFEWI
jgi:hypothetical protein